jgi:hypothetical protein
MDKESLVRLIEQRIKDEYRKHKNIDWEIIAARKIAGMVISNFDQMYFDEDDRIGDDFEPLIRHFGD